MTTHPYDDPRWLSYSQVSVNDVIRFGAGRHWAVVTRILANDTPVHWELMWAFGSKLGSREIVTPSQRVVYAARTERDAAYEIRRLRGYL